MNQADALQRVADALGGLDVRGLLTVGPAMDAGALRLPLNVVAESFVPHAQVIRHAALVVTHAGHGTTMTAVTAGIPLLCMPMGRDQFNVSARVTANGLWAVSCRRMRLCRCFEAPSQTSSRIQRWPNDAGNLLTGSISRMGSPRL